MQLVHSETHEQEGDIAEMCYGMSTGAVQWLAYEMIEKHNIKG